jgi:WXG100 family type VII secretion target
VRDERPVVLERLALLDRLYGEPYMARASFRKAIVLTGSRLRAAQLPSRNVLRPGYAPNLAGTGGRSTGCAGVDTRRSGSVVSDLGKGRLVVPNVNVTYAEMQSAARQLQAGEQTIEGDLTKLKHLVDNLVASGYVTDTSSKHFQDSYTQFTSGATRMIQGLTGMAQYLDAAVKAFGDTDAQLAAALRQ